MRLELSRRGDYAVRTMLALAEPPIGSWRSVRRIAAAMAIPERYLPRVMRSLVVAGLVEARHGRTGGYRLAQPPAGISLLDVIAAVEPADERPRCVLRGIPCGVDGRCAVHEPFDGARRALRDHLAATSLASVADTPD